MTAIIPYSNYSLFESVNLLLLWIRLCLTVSEGPLLALTLSFYSKLINKHTSTRWHDFISYITHFCESYLIHCCLFRLHWSWHPCALSALLYSCWWNTLANIVFVHWHAFHWRQTEYPWRTLVLMHTVWPKWIGEVVNDNIRSMFPIPQNGREDVISTFIYRDFMESQEDQMRTPQSY